LLEYLLPRRCVALSFRGRGNSDTPTNGYDLQDHILDIKSVANRKFVNTITLLEIDVISILGGIQMEEKNCFICRKHKGEVTVPGGWIYEDEYVYVGHMGSNDPFVYLGYLIVDLKRHVPGWGDMTEEESRMIGSVLNQVGGALKNVLNAEHIYCFVQGDAFPHFHVHVIPRYPDTPEEYWSPMGLKNWKKAQGGVEEIETVCSNLRTYLRENDE